MQETSSDINRLFILASVQEDIILNMSNPEFKQLAKMKFNRVIKEIKSLNYFVNNVLSESEIEGLDDYSQKVKDVLC